MGRGWALGRGWGLSPGCRGLRGGGGCMMVSRWVVEGKSEGGVQRGGRCVAPHTNHRQIPEPRPITTCFPACT